MRADRESFKQLRRLLTLKRYEQPPPRYFNDFSSQVIRRIQAGEGRAASLWERLFVENSWVQRIWEVLEAKPALVGAFGVVVCGLLITGVVFSGENDGLSTSASPMAQGMNGVFTAMPGSATTVAFKQPSEQSVFVSSTNPMVAPQPLGSLFDQLKLQAQPATFSVGN